MPRHVKSKRRRAKPKNKKGSTTTVSSGHAKIDLSFLEEGEKIDLSFLEGGDEENINGNEENYVTSSSDVPEKAMVDKGYVPCKILGKENHYEFKWVSVAACRNRSSSDKHYVSEKGLKVYLFSECRGCTFWRQFEKVERIEV